MSNSAVQQSNNKQQTKQTSRHPKRGQYKDYSQPLNGMTLEQSNKLVTDNMALVFWVLKEKFHFDPSTMQDYEDVVSLGMQGLVIAARCYDSSTGYSFSTYATYCISSQIHSEYFRRNQTLKVTPEIAPAYLDAPLPLETDHGTKKTLLDLLPASPSSDPSFTQDAHTIMDFIINNPVPNKSTLLSYLQGTRIIDIAKQESVSATSIQNRLKVSISYLRSIFNPSHPRVI